MSQKEHPDLDALIAEFGPKRSAAFLPLRPHTDFIRALRQKEASFDTIERILRTKGVSISDTTIRRFCHEVLAEPNQTAKRKLARRSGPRAKHQSPCEPEKKPESINGPAVPSAVQANKPPPALPTISPRPERIPGPRVANVEFIEEPKL